MQTNKFTHLIVMRPTGAFYFGGENTFKTNVQSTRVRKQGKVEDLTNYFAKSRYWPQQTALLGMLRHAMLMYSPGGSKLDATAKEKANTIGLEGYDGTKPHEFGSLHAISPIFILEGPVLGAESKARQWHQEGLDHQKYKSKDLGGTVAKEATKVVFQYDYQKNAGHSNFQENGGDHLVLMRAFVHKELLKSMLSRFQNGQNDIQELEGFFDEIVKTGVNKKEENDAFYKQMLLKFKPGYAFGFYVNFIRELPFSARSLIMPFGGDQTEVRLDFIPLKESDPMPFEAGSALEDGKLCKITLTSDAFVSEGLVADCEFVVGDSHDFRYLQSVLAPAEGYYGGANKRKLKQKVNLLQRGSVMFTRKAATVIAMLVGTTKDKVYDDAVEAYRQIGYNYYKIEEVK